MYIAHALYFPLIVVYGKRKGEVELMNTISYHTYSVTYVFLIFLRYFRVKCNTLLSNIDEIIWYGFLFSAQTNPLSPHAVHAPATRVLA